MTVADPTLRDIYLARQRIAGLARRTPLVRSAGLSERTGAAVYLKPESLQETGSFKIRGAANKLLSLTAEERARGVVAVSSGNHGRAVAYVAQQLGVRAVICVSERVPAGKVEAIRRLGAELVVHGASYDEAEAHSLRLQAERGLTRVDPFDDPAVIAGQGTIGLELLEDLPQVETVVVPLSGGGLISGIAIALKAANPAIRVIGVSMDRAPVMVHSLRAGRLLELPEEDTLADALAGGIGLDNRYTFRLVQHLCGRGAVGVGRRDCRGHDLCPGAGAPGRRGRRSSSPCRRALRQGNTAGPHHRRRHQRRQRRPVAPVARHRFLSPVVMRRAAPQNDGGKLIV